MKRKSMYKSLLGGYVFFSIISILLFIILLNILGLIWSSDAYSNNFPYNISSKEKLENNLEDIYAVNGWIECLDSDYEIMDVFGTKQTSYIEKYDAGTLLQICDGNENSESIYRGFLVQRVDADGYFLVMINRSNYTESHSIKIRNSAYHHRIDGNSLFILIAIVVYCVLCAFMGRFFYIRYGKPLKLISNGIDRMKNGEKDVQIDLKGGREFAEIRDAFNMMSYSLSIAKKEKDDAEYRKEKMILDLSHDIRTPIATIQSCVQALDDDLVGDEREKYYHIIKQKANRVSDLTEDMFTILKMNDAGYSLYKEDKDICEFLRELCIEYYVEAQNAGLTINADIPDTSILYSADYKLLSRAIGNLILNAIKYDKAGYDIFVNLTYESSGLIRISVCDDGSAIHRDLVPHLFDDFSRGDLSRSSAGGTGLGLSIGRAIIEKHGGTIKYIRKNDLNCFEILLK